MSGTALGQKAALLVVLPLLLASCAPSRQKSGGSATHGGTNQTIAASTNSAKPTTLEARIVAAARTQVGSGYTQEYFSIAYPNGDVPRHLGACTDVVIRALRAGGYDLQRLIHEDMRRHFDLYPKQWGLHRTDSNIDHRRVPNQIIFMRRFGQILPDQVSARTLSQWRPGDIVYWKIEHDLDHCGIISDRHNAQGRPFVIHNLGGGREEDVLQSWKIVGHFRYPRR